jgi:hypothetical protein
LGLYFDGERIAPGMMAIHCGILSPSNAYRHQALKRELTCMLVINLIEKKEIPQQTIWEGDIH